MVRGKKTVLVTCLLTWMMWLTGNQTFSQAVSQAIDADAKGDVERVQSADNVDNVEDPADPGPDPDHSITVIHLPMANDEVALGPLLAPIINPLGLDGDAISKLITTKANVKKTAGRVTLKAIELATKKAITFEATQVEGKQVMAIRIDRTAMRRRKSYIRSKVVRMIQAWFPEAAAKAKAYYGLHVWQPNGKRVPFEEAKLEADQFSHVVLLVHGLDEPGDIFDVTGPQLVKANHTTVQFFYPNDQRIVKSARSLHKHVGMLHDAGVKEITIVAHSMGGLVSREMLTHPDFYAGRGTGHEKLPTVRRLIMVGPPNQGANLAKLRAFAEVRETAVRLFSRDRMLFGGFFDGAGEAAEDLLPESEFILRLNARPHADDVKYTVLAALASPVTVAGIEKLKKKLHAKIGDTHPDQIDKSAEALSKLVEGIGDGAVSLETTKLKGFEDHIIVRGNHATMLDKLPEGSEKATAIGEILKRLESDK